MDNYAFGERLADSFHVNREPAFVARMAVNQAEIGVTRLRCDVGDRRMSSPMASDDAFLVSLQLRDWEKRVLWIDGRPLNATTLRKGMVSIFDLRRTWIGYRSRPFDQIALYIPRRTLDLMAEMEGLGRIDYFANDPAKGKNDPVMTALGETLRPAFERPHEVDRFFVDSVATAAAAHVVATYATSHWPAGYKADRLSKSDVDKSSELIASSLHGSISIADIARECGMTPSAFRHAFFISFGMTPYRWLTERRIEKAMQLLRGSDTPLEVVARQSGFADTRHLSRVFKIVTGMTIDTWLNASHH